MYYYSGNVKILLFASYKRAPFNYYQYHQSELHSQHCPKAPDRWNHHNKETHPIIIQNFCSSTHTASYIAAPPLHTNNNNNMSNGSVPMTPSARISALNIVGDLLRKVGVSLSSGFHFEICNVVCAILKIAFIWHL